MKTEIFNYLKTRKYVKRKELCTFLNNYGWDVTDRVMRKTIEEMITKDGYCISSSEKGYSLIINYDDAVAARAYLNKKVKALAIRGNCIIKNWNRNNKGEQLKLI